MTNENIYSAPAADLYDSHAQDADLAKFYVVAPLKFVLLYVCTFGFYKFYWFYKNWSCFKACTKDSMWPVMRAIFCIFFVHSLFRRVDETVARDSRAHSWSPGPLATGFVIFQLAANALGRLPVPGNVVARVEFLFLVPVMGFILYSAQRAINAACGDPDGTGNSRLSVVNWLWIVVGGCFVLMVIVGLAVGLRG